MVTGRREPAADRIYPASGAAGSERMWTCSTSLMRQRGPDHFTNWMTFKSSLAAACVAVPSHCTSRWDPTETAERRPLRIVIFPAESCAFARAERRQIKARGKQRRQIYTIRPAATNQPIRQRRSRWENARGAPVHVRWEDQCGEMCLSEGEENTEGFRQSVAVIGFITTCHELDMPDEE